MLFGPQRAQLVRIQPVSIHGTVMYDVVFQLQGESNPRSARLGGEALLGNPQPGDQLVVQMLMQTVTQIERAAS